MVDGRLNWRFRRVAVEPVGYADRLAGKMREMVETAVQQERSCRKCGADIRPDSLFCFNCGAELSESVPDENAPAPSTNGDGKKRPGSDPPELRSAAAIKRARPDRVRRQLETVWEEAPDRPSPLLLAATAIIVLFTAVIIVLAFYFK